MTSRASSAALLATLGVFLGCGSSDPGPAVFTQADLEGTWDRVFLTTNDSPGWSFYTQTVSAAGDVTLDTCLTQAGPCTSTGAVRFVIDGAGNVTATGSGANPTMNGTMNPAKDLILSTATVGGGTGYNLSIFRKRVPGVTWSSADVANLAFAFHAVHSGAQTPWERGAGTTDGAGGMTLTRVERPSGSVTPPVGVFDTMQVDANGIVTQESDATFHGVMTVDKSVIFGVRTIVAGSPGEYELVVRMATGGTFTLADLEGGWSFRVLTSGASASTSTWLRARAAVASDGGVAFSSAANPSGAVSIQGFTVQVAADGSTTRVGKPSYLGQISRGADLHVRTDTANAPQSSLAIWAR